MPRTLYGRLAATLLVLFALVAVLYVGLTLWSTRLYLEEANQRLHRDLARGLVSEGLIAEGGEIGQIELQSVFHTLMVVNPSIEVYLLDPDGKILAFSAPPGKVKLDRVSLEPVERFLKEPDRVPILGDDPRHPGERKVFSAAPVESGTRRRGYLYVILAGERYESALELFRRSHITRLSVGLAAAGLLLVFGAGLLFFAAATRRLRRLTRQVHGAFAPRSGPAAPTGPGDEVGELEAAFAEMQSRIRVQLAAIRGADEERRRLFTNVSHDLRTPLSSLHGLLETVLLKEDLEPAERRRYLEVALGSARRLGRLVTELFELAKLEAPEITLHPEPFSLPELLQDVAQKLGVELGARRVRAEIRAEGPEPFVVADIGLVERLLENLLRNAGRHSPAGGVISVDFGSTGEVVETRVRDQGPGIAPEDLPRLFERFFRSRRQPDEEAGTGLGLAIAKRIAELHGGTIRAENGAEGGAVFAFTLPGQSLPG